MRGKYKARYPIAILLIVITLFSFVIFVRADSDVATSIYIKGYVGSTVVLENTCTNTNSCSLSNFDAAHYCQIEGDYYLYSLTTCEAGEVPAGPNLAFNVNWDQDQADCLCYGKVWNLTGGEGTYQRECCGDDPNEYVITGNDNTRACCNLPTDSVVNSVCYTTLLTGTYFTDMNGLMINKTGLGDKVYLVAVGRGLENQEINFTVYKEGVGWFKKDKKINTNFSNGKMLWTANESGKFYFTAQTFEWTLDSRDNAVYGLLNVSARVNNSKPVAIITSPPNNAIYPISTNILFNHSSFDQDDPFTIKWYLGDGAMSEQNSFLYNYSIPGLKNIVLNVTDERGSRDSARVSILAVGEGINFLPIISQPARSGLAFGMGSVAFNATLSYALNCSTNNPAFPIELGIYNCTILPKQDLKFNWTFSDENIIGDWNNYSYFTKTFNSAGQQTVKLRLGTGLVWDARENIVDFRIYGCSGDGTTYYYEDGSSISTLGDFDCLPASGMCCPNGYSCESVENENRCKRTNQTSCEDYTTQTSCENYNNATAKYDIELRQGTGYCGNATSYTDSGLNCQNATSCYCYWNASSNECRAGSRRTRTCWDPGGNIVINQSLGGCMFSAYTQTESDEEGCSILSWNAVWNPGDADDAEARAKCVSGNEEVCVAKLDFFNWVNAIISLVIIIMIYYLYIKFTKTKKR